MNKRRRPMIQRGDVYGRLVALEDGNKLSRVLCQCNCGNQTRVFGQNLQSTNTQSCGCLRTDTEHRWTWINSRKNC